MWAHRRSEEPSSTEVASYWTKPKLSSIGTSIKLVTAEEFKKKSTESAASVPSDVSSFVTDLTAVGVDMNLKGHLLRYSADYVDTFENLSLYKLMLRFTEEGGVQYDDFIKFAITNMTESLCTEAEKKTRAQVGSPSWHELRFGRVSASKLFDFAHCKTADGTLVESIIGAYKIKDTKFMKRGRLLEKEVLGCVTEKLRTKFTSCGFFTLPMHPIFGASPDAISTEYVVEIKCPSSNKTMLNYIRDNNICDKFKAQINLQMLCARKKKGLFCVASPDFEDTKNVTIIPVQYDEEFLNGLIAPAHENWKQFVFPKLYGN